MDTKNKKRTRSQLDSDSENETGNATLYPRFLIIESTDPSRPLSKLSPFLIGKSISSIATSPKFCQKLKSGALLVEMTNKVHVESLLKLKQFFSIPSQCKPHASLNTSRGIIRCSDLAGVSIEDIIEGLADQHVTNARRITLTRDGVKRESNTIILTFQTAIIPKTLKVGYLKVPVNLYVPNPLQCYTCFKFGIMKADATQVLTTNYFVVVLNPFVQSITRDKFTTCQDPTELITTLIYNAASEAIPKTTTSPKNPNKPWFTEECKKGYCRT